MKLFKIVELMLLLSITGQALGASAQAHNEDFDDARKEYFAHFQQAKGSLSRPFYINIPITELTGEQRSHLQSLQRRYQRAITAGDQRAITAYLSHFLHFSWKNDFNIYREAATFFINLGTRNASEFGLRYLLRYFELIEKLIDKVKIFSTEEEYQVEVSALHKRLIAIRKKLIHLKAVAYEQDGQHDELSLVKAANNYMKLAEEDGVNVRVHLIRLSQLNRSCYAKIATCYLRGIGGFEQNYGEALAAFEILVEEKIDVHHLDKTLQSLADREICPEFTAGMRTKACDLVGQLFFRQSRRSKEAAHYLLEAYRGYYMLDGQRDAPCSKRGKLWQQIISKAMTSSKDFDADFTYEVAIFYSEELEKIAAKEDSCLCHSRKGSIESINCMVAHLLKTVAPYKLEVLKTLCSSYESEILAEQDAALKRHIERQKIEFLLETYRKAYDLFCEGESGRVFQQRVAYASFSPEALRVSFCEAKIREEAQQEHIAALLQTALTTDELKRLKLRFLLTTAL